MKPLVSPRLSPVFAALYGGLRNGVALFLCGASLGWLMGMSTSPVLQTVLATLLAIIATLLTATLGLPKSADQSATGPATTKPVRAYNALPLGWFLFCLAAGAAGGVFTRTNELLGTIPHIVAWRLGVSPADSALVTKQLLTEQYGLRVTKNSKNPTTNGQSSLVASRFSAAALFSDMSDSVDFCASVEGMNGPELQDELEKQITEQLNRSPAESKRRGLEQMQRLLARKPDERVLQQIKNRLCTQR